MRCETKSSPFHHLQVLVKNTCVFYMCIVHNVKATSITKRIDVSGYIRLGIASIVCLPKPASTFTNIQCCPTIFLIVLLILPVITDIDECQSEPCQNGGSCENCVNHYRCNCPYGAYGNNCEIGKLWHCTVYCYGRYYSPPGSFE